MADAASDAVKVASQALAFSHCLSSLTLLRRRSYTQSRQESLGIEDRLLTSRDSRPEPRRHRLAPRPSFHGTGAVAFSTKGEYGVRLMVQLGRHFGSGPARSPRSRRPRTCPAPTSSSSHSFFGTPGLVVSTRGAHGGYELARPPTTIHDERGAPRARRPACADDLRDGRARPRPRLRPDRRRAPSTCSGSASATPSPARSTA